MFSKSSLGLIRQQVRDEAVKFVFVLGPPRSGTTAFSKLIYSAGLHFDGNINQPGLLTRGHGDQWLPDMWNVVADKVSMIRPLNSSNYLGMPPRTNNSYPDLLDDPRALGAGGSRYSPTGFRTSSFSQMAPPSPISSMAKAHTHNSFEDVQFQPEMDDAPNPLAFLVKETSNIVCPNNHHLGQWLDFAAATVIQVRQPLLQVESRIVMNLKRFDTEAIRPFLEFNPRGADLKKFVIHGRNLIRSDADLSHVNYEIAAKAVLDTTLPTAWQQHFQHMKKSRNFSSLDEGFIDFCSWHPQHETAFTQEPVWTEYASRHGIPNAERQIKANLGTSLDEFHTLPRWQVHAFFEWQFGWTALTAQMKMPQLANNPEVRIIDFTEAQIAPDMMATELQTFLGERIGQFGPNNLKSPKHPRGQKVAFEMETNSEEQQSSQWQAWFGTPCFTDQENKKNLGLNTLKPPSKKSITTDEVPECVRDLLPDMFEMYKAVRADPRRLSPPAMLTEMHAGVDPIFDNIILEENRKLLNQNVR